MCGISGYFTFTDGGKYEEELRTSIKTISHRGPDNAGFFLDENVGMGHCRLSIVDLSENANQPMWDGDKRFCLIYNGECYNHLDLRKKMESRGIQYQSTSDTESVLYWLIEKGAEGLKDLNGFFSLALYDKERKKLLLARDRFGIKPLFYTQNNEGIRFSSELQGLLKFNRSNKLNLESLSAYFHKNYIASPHSIYHEVSKLHPGTYLSINKKGKLEMHRYFSPMSNHHSSTFHKGSIRKKIEESVRKRMMGDVELGSFLSGGLDSSIITGLASQFSEKLKTYTLVFKGDKTYDESSDARSVAQHFGTEHHEIEITEEDLISSAHELLEKVDEPFADSSSIAMYNLCKKVSREVKVALSGDGGDELFAGYRKHQALYNAHKYAQFSGILAKTNVWWKHFPQSRKKGLSDVFRKIDRFTSAASMEANERYWNWAGYGNPVSLMPKNDFDFHAYMNEILPLNIDTFDDCLKMDMAMVLEGDMLVKTDRMSMLHGLEVRVPMLDSQVVELVSSIPANKKISAFNKKKLLKEEFQDFLPKSILNKRKQGFEVPLNAWLKGPLQSKMNQLLDRELIQRQGLFSLDAINDLQSMLYSSNSSNSEFTLWALMVFNSWWLKEEELV